MNSLTQFLVDGILLERIEKTIVVYSGRFQPFHKGHFATYQNLIKKFGKDSVYIATSNKTDNQKSPFNFMEKKLIMQKMLGIPSDKIVEVRNPYAPMEVLANYPEETTGFITVVGEKDEMRLSGKYFTPYKGKVEMGYKDKGYVYASPAQPNPISGTEVRNWLKAGDEQSKKDFLKAYPKFDEKIFKLITLKLGKLSEDVLSEIASSNGIESDGEPESGYSPDGTLRIIDRGKPEPWLKQLGMKQIDKPKADPMRGVGRHKDKESQFRKLYYKVQNIKGTDLDPAMQPHKVEDWEEVDAGKKVKKIKRFWEVKENDKDEKHPKQQPQPSGLGFDFDSVGEPSPYLTQPKSPNTPNFGAMDLTEGPTKGLYGGTIKIGGTPVKIEVELIGADNKTKEFITKVIHIDKQYQSKLPIGSTFKIPARIFRTPGGGWYKIKHKAFEMAKADMDAVEKYADSQMSPEDIELGKESDHFFQRLNDPRNGKEISPAELTGFFKRLAKNKKKFLEFLKQYREFVVTDNRSKINIAFLKVANKLIAKTVMRKADFKSATPVFTTEVVARYIEPNRVETFLKKYPKVEDLMQRIVDKVKDVNRGYQIFLHYKEDKGLEKNWGGKKLVKPKSTNVKGLGRTALNKTGKSLNSKPIYNYEWNGKIDGPIWGELFQYVWNKKYESTNESINESLLLEGGAYGHMNHPFDVQMNLTFGDLKNIVKKALSGKLELAREKTDGQALAISWVNGRLVAARNKSHLKSKGKDAMGVQDVISKFAGRGSVSDAFSFAIKDLESAVKGLSDKDKRDIFKDGKCFMNCEIIYPENTNVVPYGTSLLVFHGTMEYNEAGDAVGENPAAGAKLATMVKQINAHVQSKFTLQGPPVQKLPVNKDLKAKQPVYLGMISKLQSEFGLSDKNGVADYHQAWWRQFVDKNASSLDEQQKIGLVKRWAFGDKSFRLADIKDAKLKAWADQTDKKDQAKITKDNLLKFEEIFLGVGADVLSFMTSVLTANPEAAKQQMVGRLETAISSIRATGDAKNLAKLEIELARLNALGGFDKIVPNEGIVFTYKGATYKLTGAFAPLNQILGIFTFSR